MDGLAGYRGAALELLKRAGATIGDVLEVTTGWGEVTGTLVPRYLYSDDEHIVLKLRSGYNVGLAVSKLKGVKVKAKGEKPSFVVPPTPKSKEGLPRVLIVSTGGTIASRVDYRTGGVHPVVTSDELYALIPELSEVANVEPEVMFSIFSENVESSHWSKLAERVMRAVQDRFDGVVITQGTDTLGYTAAALSFALSGVPIPVVITAAQRSSDRPSTDATLNLLGSVTAAAGAGFSGIYVAMHLDESDDRVAFHRGTRVRKFHTSARDAFKSVGVPLAAIWGRSGFDHLDDSLPHRGHGSDFKPRTAFDERVALVKFYPTMPPSFVEALESQGTRALVIEGTGLGHVNSRNVTALRNYISKGGLAFMTSQCINGRVDLEVYDTGRDLIAAGVVPLDDMLAETALVKAMWALGNTKTPEEAKRLMVQNLAGETTARLFPS
ncbi:MAG: Glu-tRNA(Gln) amidotransferase subunit GatD [Nitrososphaerales archaeon]|nr:Glu-tRNA(Gln) amidotransferase subunit GatD [Nitrososphaerales archaeon]